jgi:hypothetical protein
MPTYRFYCLDGDGYISSAEWLEADSDGDAVAMVEKLHPQTSCEVWSGPKLIGTTTAQNTDQSA